MTPATTRTQRQKGEAFRALHARPQTFVIPNPWDPGTARLLAVAGFEALATTSAGYAFSAGRRDGTVSRDEMMEHVGRIVVATDLPVSADLESGFGDDPRVVAETIRLGAERGLVGASIEDLEYADLHGRAARLHDRAFAAERVRAAVDEARKLPFPFTLTARCENFLVGNPDLDDTIARLQAYQEAGADVLYAPGTTTRAQLESIVRSVDRPVNFVAGLAGEPFTLGQLAAIGVRRVSLGSTLARAALGAFLRAVAEMKDRGSFAFADDAVAYAEISAMLDA
jgi:2-methylisocitrate lyase-like PEP mutase family enzyme